MLAFTWTLDAAGNYNGATADGRAVGGYWFIGWTIGAEAEANYFMQTMRPLAENDVYALDIEAIPAGVDPVPYVLTMVDTIHGAIGVYPLVYMNLSTLNAHDWDAILANCGLWLADWNGDPSVTLPTLHTYVMQQYSDGPVYDHDEWFGSVAEFQAYGWHAATSVPPPIAPAPVVAPTTPAPVVTPAPTVVSNPPAGTVVTTPSSGATGTLINTTPLPSPSKPTQIIKPTLTTNKSVGSESVIIRFINWLFNRSKKK